MQITDKTRKVLWGRSGNRCAVCKKELVIGQTASDDSSIVSDECHIISSRPKGPRHDPSYPLEKTDSYDNLVLLCRTHHKMVDDQTATFTVDRLRQAKSSHEAWVSQRLAQASQPPNQVRVRRVKKNILDFLSRLTSGQEVLAVVTYAMAYSFDHDDLNSQEEVDLVGGFLQLVQEWGDLSDMLESGERVQTAYNLTMSLRELEERGFFVFGGRETGLLEGGAPPEPSRWPIAILRVLRKDNQAIVTVNLEANSPHSEPAARSPQG